jgi:hypothetical protein
MRNKHKAKREYTFEQRLEYLGFETKPCEKCSNKDFICYPRKGVPHKHAPCPIRKP